MVAPTTFRSITDQLSNLSILPPEPKNPLTGARTLETTVNGIRRRYYPDVTKKQMDQYAIEAPNYYQIATRNRREIERLTQQTFTLLSSHLLEAQYATPEERSCLVALDGAIVQNQFPFQFNETPEANFNISLAALSTRVTTLRNQVNDLHRELHNEALGNLDHRITNLENRWRNVQPEHANVTRDLKQLQENELKRLVPSASDPNQYSVERYKVRERIARINEIAKTLQQIQEKHPVDPAQPIHGQIQAVYDKEQAWENITGFPRRHPIITTGVILATVAFGASYIPGTASYFKTLGTPQTYKPVVNIVKSVFGSAWNFGAGIVQMFRE